MTDAERARAYTHARGLSEELVIVLAIAAAAVGVELAYAGRAGTGWGSPVYWSCEVAIFVLTAFGVGRRSTTEAMACKLLAALAGATFLIRASYSPLRFSFPDELQHLRSLLEILSTHHLFHTNPSLPVGPAYPGLEILTSSVVSLTGVSTFAGGLIVTGFAHLTLTLAVYALFREVSRSTRVAGLAAVVYATAPHFQYFDAIFAYQTAALPLFAVALLCAIKVTRDGLTPASTWAWSIAGVLASAAVALTHHVSMLALVVFLLLTAVVSLRERRLAPSVLAAFATVFYGVWILVKANKTVAYLGHPISADLLAILPSKSGAANVHASLPPLSDRLLAYASVALTTAFVVSAWWKLRRRKSFRSDAVTLMVIASLSYPLILGVRLFAADGSELTGRALSFVMIPVSYLVAVVLVPRLRGGRQSFVVAAVALLLAGGIASGWPPWWERLPGSFRVASFERGVDRRNLAAAYWARNHLSKNNRVGGDFTSQGLLGTIGDQDPVRDVASIVYARSFRQRDAVQVRDLSLRYLVIDRRMLDELPAVGGYFANDPIKSRTRELMPRESLDKFNRLAGISRIYDNGAMVIYDLRGSVYSPG